MLRNFIEHCLRGTNYATGKIGSPLDLVDVPRERRAAVPPGRPRADERSATSCARSTTASRSWRRFPSWRTRRSSSASPIRKAAPPARCGRIPSNAYRNGTMYSSYTAEQIARTYQLADLHRVNLLGAVTWAFVFEDQPYFDGFRDLATNGIDKPVLNVFRMLGQMTGNRVAVDEQRRADARRRPRRERARPGRHLGARDAATARSAAVLVWNYHDDDLPAPAADVAADDRRPAGRAADAVRTTAWTPRSQQRVRALEGDGLAAAADAGPDMPSSSTPASCTVAGPGRAARWSATGAWSSDLQPAAAGRLAREGDLVGDCDKFLKVGPARNRCRRDAFRSVRVSGDQSLQSVPPLSSHGALALCVVASHWSRRTGVDPSQDGAPVASGSPFTHPRW